MNNKVNRVKVVKDFPGYKEGDVLELDSSTGVFHFINTTTEDGLKGDAFDLVTAEITGEIKPPITKKEVSLYLGTLFEDVSIYKVRSYRELQNRVEELKATIDRLKDEDAIFGTNLDRDEALTVWQNMLWEYEWIMGERELYGIVPDGVPTFNTTTEEAKLPDGDFQGFIDGNAEEARNESTTDNEDRETY